MSIFDGLKDEWEPTAHAWVADVMCLLCVLLNILLWPLIFYAVL